MKSEKIRNLPEKNEKPSFTPPPVELFSDSSSAAEAWPKKITENKDFLAQIEARARMNKRLDAVLAAVPRPDMTLETAVAEKRLTEKQTADLYDSLSDLLSEVDYQRIIFYLPFEFLPGAAWKPSADELQRATEKFRTAYLSAWHNLLTTQDVRANFVDGDVLDVESRTGDLPRVVKAAHIIPKLVELGWLKTSAVISLAEKTTDEILKSSIAEALPVLTDMRLTDETDKRRINTLKVKRPDETKPANITKKRAAWLAQEEKRKAIDAAGQDIAAAITAQTFDEQAAEPFLSANADKAKQLSLIEGIRRAIERAESAQALTLFNRFKKVLSNLWDKDTPAIHEALTKTYFRLNGLGVVSDAQIKALGLTRPHLAGPFSENLHAFETELQEIKKIAMATESDPAMANLIYPVALVFGSRLKGYGATSSDLDIGVFIRPEASAGDAAKLQSLLAKTFSHEKIHGEIVQFRLKKNKTGLTVIDSENAAALTGDSSWAHVLFGAAWTGNADVIKELREQLLVPYFYDEEKTVRGRDARGLYLEEMERDTLQYRLMHKGYEKFYPAVGRINTPHAGQIDGQSVFWDSGYRRMATQLFTSRVFLPKLKP